MILNLLYERFHSKSHLRKHRESLAVNINVARCTRVRLSVSVDICRMYLQVRECVGIEYPVEVSRPARGESGASL